MKKAAILILSAMLISLISACPVSAQLTLEVENGTDTLTVNGSSGGALPYENVSIVVVKPQGSISAVNNAQTLQDNLYYYNQVNATESCTYTFNVDMQTAASGRYTVIVSSAGEQLSTSIFYATADYAAEIIRAVNEKSTGAEIGAILDISSSETDTADIFNLTDELIYQVSAATLLDVFAQLNSTDKIDPETPSELTDKIVLSAAITGLNEGKSFEITDYKDLLGLDAGYVSTYEAMLSDSVKDSFTASFKNAGITDSETAAEVFEDKVILAVINNIRNRSDIEYIIDTYGADMGIDVSAFNSFSNKSSLVDSLGAASPYASVEAFVSSYNTLYSSLTPGTPVVLPGTAGGGGGGGGVQSGFSGIEDTPVSSDEYQAAQDSVFADLNEAEWAKEYIIELYREGIISGVSKTSFAPAKGIKREEYIKMLVGALKLDKSSDTLPFNDTDENAWYYGYLLKANEAGIINGYSDGSFGVGRYISRQEMITVSYRAALYAGKSFDTSSADKFEDDYLIEDYAREAIYAFKNAGIVSGSGGNAVNPANNLTRAEAAKIICLLREFGGA